MSCGNAERFAERGHRELEIAGPRRDKEPTSSVLCHGCVSDDRDTQSCVLLCRKTDLESSLD
ncbi:MAG: hypothetical protein BMS9Abin28_0909 [Anaerolineae bacterium]|nr:MAG: hypothetical protein BMS9Abin28_0909 [Anaerolineae bacterium]